jgi:alkylated DNA repair dioxygenase AlkB
MNRSRSIIPQERLTLFGEPDDSPDVGNVAYHSQVFDLEEALALEAALDREIEWKQDFISMYGQTTPLPRLTAWHGDPGFDYTYSGISMHPSPWTPALGIIKNRIEELCQAEFNSALANKYRNGKDSVSWHSDDEPELGPTPLIGSVSFGATRRFLLRRKPHQKGASSLGIDLESGSCLVMSGLTQANWEHSIGRTSRPIAQRINLTFRKIVT